MKNTDKAFIRTYKTYFYLIIELNTNNYNINHILNTLHFIITMRSYKNFAFFLMLETHPSCVFLEVDCSLT